MRKSFLLSGILLASFLALRCDGKQVDDDDDDAGESGESGEGGKAGKGGSAGKGGATGGSAGSSVAMGGASGSSAPGTGGISASGGTGGAGAAPATGGTGGTGGTGESGMAGEPGTGGTTGGTDGTGGTTGGTGGTGGTTGGTGGTGGTAGMGPVSGAGGTAGKGGSGGKAGTGGTGGKAGSGGAAGSGGKSCGVGEGLALTSEPGTAGVTGWIEGDNNCVGIQGAVQVSMDLEGSSITLTETDGQICVSGHAEQVVSGNFEDYWGTFVSIQLNNPGTGVANPYDSTTYGVDGFSFTLSGEDVPVEIRPTLIVNGSTAQYCKRICAEGDQSMLLSEANLDCWDGTAGATPSATALTILRFAIPSIETADVTFDFCIDELAAITDNVSIGNPGECPVTPPDPIDSCEGRCGDEPSTEFACQCDGYCLDYDDCCSDFLTLCMSG